MNFFRKFKAVIAIGLPVLLAACGSGKVVVYDPVVAQYPVKTINIVSNMPTSSIPEEYKATFEDNLKQKLYQDHGYKQGDDLTVTYRFLQCDEGSQFSRWFLGGLGNAGEGSLTVETKFTDKYGKEIGKVNTEGKIGSGFLGGSFRNAVEQAAEYLAQYIVKNFKQ